MYPHKHSPNRIETFEDIKKATEDSIIKTNIVINRWINVNNVSKNKIYDEEIRGLLIGHLKKDVFIDRLIDFRRLNKNLQIATFVEKSISLVLLNDLGSWFNDKNFIDNFSKAIKEIDYVKLSKNIEQIDTNINTIVNSELVNVVDFEKLNKFKF